MKIDLDALAAQYCGRHNEKAHVGDDYEVCRTCDCVSAMRELLRRLDIEHDWKTRYEDAADAFHMLKSMTKKVRADSWTPEYRELAEQIHTLGRDFFYVGE